MIVRIRKYKFANLENWTIKFRGRKVKKLYFEVMILLFEYAWELLLKHRHFLRFMLVRLTWMVRACCWESVITDIIESARLWS